MTLLAVEGLRKQYRRGRLSRQITFSLAADFRIEAPAVVGMMGPNGSGKTTLFELITGSNRPSSGHVLCCGKNIHRVRYESATGSPSTTTRPTRSVASPAPGPPSCASAPALATR